MTRFSATSPSFPAGVIRPLVMPRGATARRVPPAAIFWLFMLFFLATLANVAGLVTRISRGTRSWDSIRSFSPWRSS